MLRDACFVVSQGYPPFNTTPPKGKSMSFKVNLDLEFFWSITDNNELKVELAPKNRPEDVKAEFTFDAETIVAGLDEDLEELSYGDADVDLGEWLGLAQSLRNLANIIDARIEGLKP